MTLADVLARLETADLGPAQRADQASAVRTVARLLGAPPAEIAADPARLRRRLEGISPEAAGLSRGRWANVRSLLGKALAHGWPIVPGRSAAAVDPRWTGLCAALTAAQRIRLSALLRFLSAGEIGPDRVSLEDLLAFGRAMEEDRLRRNPGKTWDNLVWTWNAAVRSVPGWPPILIPRACRRASYVLPWEAFPASLKADVDAFLRRQGARDYFGDGPARPLKASSLRTRERQLRLAASALIHRGVPAEDLRALADLVVFDRFKEALAFFLDRKEGETSPQIGQVAGFLRSVAAHWVGVDAETLQRMSKIVGNLAVGGRGMTERNRRRLQPLDDPETVRRFLALPETILAALARDPGAPRTKAIRAQCAAAIAILLVAPIRISNLAALDMNRHLVGRGGRVFLVIPGEEVKNGEPVDLELPEATLRILSVYLRDHRPRLLRGVTDALFPGEGGGAKKPGTLGPQIAREALRVAGLAINPHLFRHATGKIFLDRCPGEYEVVRRVLGHKSLATTTAIYAGAETRAAGRYFAAALGVGGEQDAAKAEQGTSSATGKGGTRRSRSSTARLPRALRAGGWR